MALGFTGIDFCFRGSAPIFHGWQCHHAFRVAMRGVRHLDAVSDEARNDRSVHAIGHGKTAELEAALRAIFSQRDFPRIQDASDLLLGGIT